MSFFQIYLSQYGYLNPKARNPTSGGNLLAQESWESAIKDFQGFAGLNITGKFRPYASSCLNPTTVPFILLQVNSTMRPQHSCLYHVVVWKTRLVSDLIRDQNVTHFKAVDGRWKLWLTEYQSTRKDWIVMKLIKKCSKHSLFGANTLISLSQLKNQIPFTSISGKFWFWNFNFEKKIKPNFRTDLKLENMVMAIPSMDLEELWLTLTSQCTEAMLILMTLNSGQSTVLEAQTSSKSLVSWTKLFVWKTLLIKFLEKLMNLDTPWDWVTLT